MSSLTVGLGQQYTTIAAAVNAAESDSNIDVQAGTYTNDFVTIYKNLTLNAVGGTVTLVATVAPPNGKAILTEGGSGLTVNINGFAFAGATVPDANGAGIRYEGGTLNVTNSHFYDNQNGILGASDPNGVISIRNSEFDHNGTGDGHTHNVYIGDIAQFTLSNSYTHDANVGHEIKSRAENNTIINNRIVDNDSTSSYEIDLPNGGNAIISANTIQQGANSQNPNLIAYGEEGNLHMGTSLSVTGNTFVNDLGRGAALWNAGSGTATFANNSVYGFGSAALVSGAADQSGTTVLASRPTLDTLAVDLTPTSPPAPMPTPMPAPTPTPVATAPPQVSTTGLVLNLSEDAYLGNAQYTVLVDGQQIGDVRTETVLHSSGRSDQVTLGALSAGLHQIAVTFLNNAYAGTPSTDRNLYVDEATYNGQSLPGGSLVLMSAGTQTFTVTSGAAPTQDPTPMPAPAPTPVATAPPQVSTTGLVLNLSEDAYLGDAQYTVLVDGQQIGDVRTETVLHSSGRSDQVTLGALSAGLHQIAVTFLNDAYAGTPSTDRNLYVDEATYNGQSLPGGSLVLMSAGTQTFTVTDNAASTPIMSSSIGAPSFDLVVNVSEDAYLGDAQFTIAVDGNQIGGIYTGTASHSDGQSRAITLTDIAKSFAPHDIAVTFLNDAYDGTPSTDRNLYVDSIQFDHQNVPGASAVLTSAGTQHFMVPLNWAD